MLVFKRRMSLGCASKFIVCTLSSSFIGSCPLDHLAFSPMLIFQSIPLKKSAKSVFRMQCPRVGRRKDHPQFKSFFCLMPRRVGVSPRRSAFLTPPLSECRIRLCPWRALKLTARDTINAFSLNRDAEILAVCHITFLIGICSN